MRLMWKAALLGLIVCVMSAHAKKKWKSSIKVKNLGKFNINLLSAHPECTKSVTALNLHQTAMCVKGYEDHIWASNIGLQMALNECRRQFSYGKWNCSTVNLEKMFEGQGTHIATKEDAFVHAITAAGLAHAIARACTTGNLTQCGCNDRARPEGMNVTWQWGGCGDNIKYGYDWARYFGELRYAESAYGIRTRALAEALTKQHNDESGRVAVRNNEKVQCRCAGNSASCAVRVCWVQLKDFRAVGRTLKNRYDSAQKVKFNNQGTRIRRFLGGGSVKPGTMAYLDSSPNYCDKSVAHASHGTVGRQCNATSPYADNCDTLCCGRGYTTVEKDVQVDCNCRFYWCCEIRCQKCDAKEERQYCN